MTSITGSELDKKRGKVRLEVRTKVIANVRFGRNPIENVHRGANDYTSLDKHCQKHVQGYYDPKGSHLCLNDLPNFFFVIHDFSVMRCLEVIQFIDLTL